MITLSNLHKQSRQDVFNHIAKHLLKQNKKSKWQKNEDFPLVCAYRGNDGLQCAVGCIISPDEYKVSMEGKSSTKVISMCNPIVNMDMLNMLRDLQVIHDDIELSEWSDELKKVASKYRLKIEEELFSSKEKA